jgi:hypothetical protein
MLKILKCISAIQAMWHYVILGRVRVTIVTVEKQYILQNPDCVPVALVKRDAKRMRRIILSSVGCLDVPCSFHLPRCTVFEKKKVFERKTYFDFSYFLFYLKYFPF